nr:hypothetical protein [Brevibacillus laterosporus]
MIAHRLGVKRETANRRINRLLKYRWDGREVVRASKVRGGAMGSGRIRVIRCFR